MFNVPILFIIFNRLETTKQVFEAIRNIQPSKLFIAADGARENIVGEFECCNEIREYVLKNIDWDCEVKTLFSPINLGCGLGPASAISWFFKQVEEGIILEDDCLPHPDFFVYCSELLEKYRNNRDIAVIGGDNFQEGIKRGDASYYFSKYSYTWGWASWRRSWQNYQFDLNAYDKFKMYYKIDSTFKTSNERIYWKFVFDSILNEPGQAWDFQLWFHVWYNDMISIAPNVNLVKNIGFGIGATHTVDINSRQALIETKSILPIIHPISIKVDEVADYYYYSRYWNLQPEKSYKSIFVNFIYTFLPQSIISGYRRIKRHII